MNENARKFDHRIKNPDPHIVASLAAIDEIRGVFRVGLRMTPQAVTSLRKSVLVTSAGSSTRIEGSKLSDEEVKKIMGFEPVVITGPKLWGLDGKEDDTVFFQNEGRRLYIIRPHVGDNSTESFLPGELDEQKEKWV